MLEIKFSTGNAAFMDENGELDDYSKAMESVRILKEVIAKISTGHSYGSCMDINGNKVGEWRLN